MDRSKFTDLGLSYHDAAHGMQSGVAYEMSLHGSGISKETEPKNLRVGINSALSETAALALLLMEKGIFTEEEYLETIRLMMNNELALYERKHLGKTFR